MIYAIIHGMVILYQLITLSVAINSQGSVLLTVVISNQFMELKVCSQHDLTAQRLHLNLACSHQGSVMKRSEILHLFQVTCSDVRERFQLFVLLCLLGV